MNFILKLAYLYKVTEKKRLMYMHLLLLKTRRSRFNAQSPNKPRLLAEKGGRIFARVRYWTTFNIKKYS